MRWSTIRGSSTTSINSKARSNASMPTSVSEAAAALHRRAILVDGHCDTPYRMLRHNVRLDEHDPEAQLDLRSLRESGITASFFAAYVPPFYAGRGAKSFAYRVIDLIRSEAVRYPDLPLWLDPAGIGA